jgi:hypothetical protein
LIVESVIVTKNGEDTAVKGLPKMVVRDSAASRNWVVAMALALSASMGTSVKEVFMVETQVWPAARADMMARSLVVN